MDELIRLENVCFAYGKTQALRDVSFIVEAGAFFCFLGPNGAGKTTTVRMLTGQLRPAKGQAWVLGFDVARQRNRLIRSIGVLTDDMSLPSDLTVEEILELSARAFGADKPTAHNIAQYIVSEVGLGEWVGERIGRLSSGLRRRVEIAQALVNDSSLIFLDEPTIGLDPISSQQIRKLVSRIHSGGTTVFYTTHLLYEVEELCTHLAIIDRGQIVLAGALEEIRKQIPPVVQLQVSDPQHCHRVTSLINQAGLVATAEGQMVTVSARKADPQEVMDQVLDLLRTQGIGITSAAIKESSLEDIYSQVLTGEDS